MRTVAVTGSASGIGRAICTRLAASGDRVIGVFFVEGGADAMMRPDSY